MRTGTIKVNALFICFLLSGLFSYAQSEKERGVFTERIVLHTSTNFLVTGETLCYSIFCLNKEGTFSTLSKLAYVELIDENEKAVFQNKVSLFEGTGAGDFFLPSNLVTGNYTLIAYTKWMRNFPTNDFFQKQITIVNPYLKSLKANAYNNNEKTTTFRSTKNGDIKISDQIQLTLDKKKYSPRQKSTVVLKNTDPAHDLKISLSVHSFDKNIEALSEVDSLNKNEYHAESQKKDVRIAFLPDLRGETLEGIVTDRSSHLPIAGANIYASAAGNPFIFQVSKTDSIGRFCFSSKEFQTRSGIQFQIENRPESTFEVTLDDPFIHDYGDFKPLPLLMDTVLRRQIEQRNVYSQIENAYFARKRDSVLQISQRPFFGKADKVYNLDDFTRFPTMEDIFREYMFEVVVLKREKKFEVHLMNSRNTTRFLNTPLMLMDGVRIFDTERLMNFDPLLIKRISLVTREYVYAGVLYDGILSIDTYSGTAKEMQGIFIEKKYLSWQPDKKYYSPVYQANDDLKRIPDYRVQLFWNPTIDLKPGQEFNMEFYTSDVVGDFIVEANGYNSKGDRVNIKQHIEVQK